MKIVFWQNMISPHLSPFISEIGNFRKGWQIVLVVEKNILEERKNLGWEEYNLSGVEIIINPDQAAVLKLLQASEKNTFHIFSGIFANPMVKRAFQSSLRYKIKRILLTEYVNLSGYRKYLRRAYALFVERRYRKYFDYVLAISSLAESWYKEVGFKKGKIFSFWYTVSVSNIDNIQKSKTKEFRILYVGQLIKRKRVEWLLKAIDELNASQLEKIKVDIFGSGNLKDKLQLCAAQLGIQNVISFKGVVTNSEIRSIYSNYDLLVLPSEHDGWGAVVNEALLCGTPVLCSSRCGVKDLVDYSGFGKIFSFNSYYDFFIKLSAKINEGKVTSEERERISRWTATYINPSYAAKYFVELIEYFNGEQKMKPEVAWRKGNSIYMKEL